MTPFIDFWKWLWSDWERPNFLTRMGVPRIVTNLFSYLLGPFIGYLVMKRYAPIADQKALREFVHNPWILSSYAVFYAVAALGKYLRFKYPLSSRDASRRIQVFREHSKDIFIRTYWATLIISLMLFLIGAFQLWSHWPLVN
jgi:hypothetical protein